MITRLRPEDFKKKTIVRPEFYNMALKRWGKKYCDEHLIKDKTAPRSRKNV